jgi:hypothetical protein
MRRTCRAETGSRTELKTWLRLWFPTVAPWAMVRVKA